MPKWQEVSEHPVSTSLSSYGWCCSFDFFLCLCKLDFFLCRVNPGLSCDLQEGSVGVYDFLSLLLDCFSSCSLSKKNDGTIFTSSPFMILLLLTTRSPHHTHIQPLTHPPTQLSSEYRASFASFPGAKPAICCDSTMCTGTPHDNNRIAQQEERGGDRLCTDDNGGTQYLSSHSSSPPPPPPPPPSALVVASRGHPNHQQRQFKKRPPKSRSKACLRCRDAKAKCKHDNALDREIAHWWEVVGAKQSF